MVNSFLYQIRCLAGSETSKSAILDGKQLFISNYSLLLRRFVFRMAEASAKRVTGDEPQETMGRVQRTFSSKERRLGTRQIKLSV